MKKTKIVATMGPASTASKEVLRSMILEGVDVCRLNFSHGSHEDHLRTINMIREINREEGLHISILADLQGPKIRIGEVENNAVELADGSKLVITTSPCLGTAEKVHLTYSDFPKDVAISKKKISIAQLANSVKRPDSIKRLCITSKIFIHMKKFLRVQITNLININIILPT